MTRPVQEPSTQRQVSGLEWGVQQLARRPAPTGGAVVYGEAYKSADQNINDTTYTRLTSWALWNTPFDDRVTDYTNGLEIVTEQYVHVAAYVAWNTGTFTTGDGWYGTIAFSGTGGGTDSFIDRIQSPVVIFATSSFDTNQLQLNWGGLVNCPAGTNFEVWVQQESGATQSVQDAYLRVAAFCTSTPFDPRP